MANAEFHQPAYTMGAPAASLASPTCLTSSPSPRTATKGLSRRWKAAAGCEKQSMSDNLSSMVVAKMWPRGCRHFALRNLVRLPGCIEPRQLLSRDSGRCRHVL